VNGDPTGSRVRIDWIYVISTYSVLGFQWGFGFLLVARVSNMNIEKPKPRTTIFKRTNHKLKTECTKKDVGFRTRKKIEYEPQSEK
jgi:hypothetical protein